MQYAEEPDQAVRKAMLPNGQRLATAHRDALKHLICQDPRTALQLAVPTRLRQALPQEVDVLLERRVAARANFEVHAAEEECESICRVVEVQHEYFRAFVFGRRLRQPTTENDWIMGIAVDDVMAVDERPVRVLEADELPASNRPIVDASPEVLQRLIQHSITPSHRHSAPLSTNQSILAEAGGAYYRFCCADSFQQFERELVAYEGFTGGPVFPANPVPSTASTGLRSVLYLRLAFPDVLLEPQTEAAAYDLMAQVNGWYSEMSYGNLYLLTTVAPLVILPRTEAWYKNRDSEALFMRDDAVAAARRMGFDGDQFNHVVFAYSGGPGSFNGKAITGGKYVWLKNFTFNTAAHELGHNFGLWHANFWDTGGQSIIGPGSNVEYGNTFDNMGTCNPPLGHFSALWKNQIGWLPDEFVHAIRQNGTYRVHAFDQSRLDAAWRLALKIRKDSVRYYWAEFRQQPFASNPWLQDGILLNWSPWSKSNAGSQLLDTTPGSPDGKNDAALTIGRTFSDPDAGIHITPIGKGGTIPESIDVVVNVGKFSSNLPPSVLMTASQTNINPGVVVNFSATATDAEGDTLAFFWDFGDKTYSDDISPVAVKSWSTAGDYMVRCLVSDMKGGTASQSVLVRVGSPATYSISGQVTFGGQPLANVRVHNGQTGASYRGAFTDSDGTYRITGLSAGTVTLSAVLYGYTFTANFTNPVTVGPDFSGANFTAQETVRVTITATDPAATEGGDTATIVLSRTGSTASALKVLVSSFLGTADTFDYTFDPSQVYDSGLLSLVFIIPAGQSSLSLTVTASNDGLVEGPELLIPEFLSGANYNLVGETTPTIAISDADSTLPLVSIEALDADASEAGDTGTVRISRVGTTNSDLTVQLDLSGSAANGVDYSILPTNVVIPAGQTSVSILVSPIADSITEGTESIVLTLASNASYFVSPTANEATVAIVDDDIPTVTITAPDAAASEAGQDPGIFVIARTGDTGAPLTVHYAISGTAQHGVDYDVLPGLLTIPAGASSGSITVVPLDDTIGEPSQTVQVQIRGGAAYAVGYPSNATVTIADNDLPVVTVGVSDATFGEPSGTGQFKFTTTGSGSGTITVRYTVTGTATPGADYVALPGTLSMAKNSTATVTVTPLDDTTLEDLETVTVTIDADPAYTTFLDQTATLRLLDNERNLVDVAPSRGTFTEANANLMQFYISRQGPTTAALTVNYVMSGTASNGVDYTSLPGTATIAAGQVGVNVSASVINDAEIEGTETVILTLVTDAAYGLGIASATNYIIDDEAPSVIVSFTNSSASGNESVGTVNLPVTLSAPSPTNVTVEYALHGGTAVAGIDYVFTSGILNFAPGITETNLTLTILDDAFVEPTQTVVIILTNAWNAAVGAGTFTYTIQDNDGSAPATVGFAATTSAAGENFSTAELWVSLSATQAATVTVHYSVTGGTATGGGVDYALNPGTLAFAPGELVKPITIAIVDDTISEANETIVVTLDSPTGVALNANSNHTYTIQDLAGTLVITPSSGLAGAGYGGGPFSPSNVIYTLSNIGDTAVNWTAASNAAWVGLSATGGTLAPGATTNVMVAFGSEASSLLPQNHTASVGFTNTSNNNGTTNRSVSLSVLLGAPALDAEPAFTSGTANTITWDQLAGAEYYEAQLSTSADFASTISSGWITNASHTFTGLAYSIPYYYRVRAWRTAATPPASPWSATVTSIQTASSLFITIQPSNLLVQVGSNATFSVNATGEDPLMYQWYFNTVAGPVAEATNAMLVLTNVQTSQAGSYFVIVTNSAGAVTSQVAVLTVNRPPVIGATNTLARTGAGGVKIAVTNLLAWAGDPDGDALSLWTVSSPSTNNGTVSTNLGWVVYSPPANLSTNLDAFSYTVADGRGGLNTNGWVRVVTLDALTALEPALTNGNFQITFNSIPGLVFRIESVPNAGSTNWLTIGSNTVSQMGFFYFTVPATNPNALFRSAYP